MKEPIGAYDLVEAEVERNSEDFRPESYRIRQDGMEVVGHLDTKPKGWAERCRLVLTEGNVFRSVEALQAAEVVDHTSLGLVKPRKITRVYMKRKPDSQRAEWDEQRAAALKQRDLFVDAESETRDLAYMPVQYRACFTCDDPACTTEHDFSILDWGTYVLSRREFALKGAALAEQSVIQKIQELMDPAKRQPYFFLGNTKAHSRNFMIVSFFHPPNPKEEKKKTKPTTAMLPGF
jgi:hypothetical protein